MGQETEIKLRVRDLPSLRKALKSLGARKVSGGMGHVHEWNIAFDTPDGELKRRGQLLRIRTERPVDAGGHLRGKTREVTLTFKKPTRARGTSAERRSRAHKVREEMEMQITDGDALRQIIEELGMRVWFRYEKFRTTFCLPDKRWAAGLLIELDETPIGTFVELEGAAVAIDRAAKALGFSSQEYITANYFVLYRDECHRRGVEPRDMVFANAK